MKFKLFLGCSLIVLCHAPAQGQPVRQLVLEQYFTALTQQHQRNTEITTALQQISPALRDDFQRLLSLKDKDATLPWAYFTRKLGRVEGGAALVDRSVEARKLDQFVRRYHDLHLVDPYSQTTIDTAQSLQRLSFFEVKPGAKIAEIGFGYGYNLHLLALTSERIEIFANELDPHRLQQMQRTIAEEYPAAHRDNFHFISGAPRSTNLEGADLNLIIMENVMHHIEDQPIFIHSMLESLNTEGKVVIIEEFSGSARATAHCPDLMARSELERLFAKVGFMIEEEKQLGYKTMLRLSRKAKPELDE